MSEASQAGAWQPKPPSAEVDPESGQDIPQAVRDEERFLDAVASKGDDDTAEVEALRDVVSGWYDEIDGVSRQPKPESPSQPANSTSPAASAA